MNLNLIDTHCHLNDAKAFTNVGSEILAMRESGVERAIVVGTDPADWERAISLAERFEELFAIVGWHPNYTKDYDSASLAGLTARLSHPKVLALGEIGLDYHWDYAPRDLQMQALHEQLDLAVALGLPVVFHAREAYGDLLDLLERRPIQPYLFHCFAGNQSEAKRATKLDAYFGVDGPISYKSAQALRDCVATLPPDRIVLETDSPYMTPVPYRGKPNRPAYVRYVAEALAAVRGWTLEACAQQTTENAERFFRIPKA